jgi:uncharacterized protein YecE (DUF72 family)
MEFGRVETEDLNNIDFSLPNEPASNRKVLSRRKRGNAKVYVGCAKWGRLEWIGKIYPHGTREKDFLQHYVKHYNSIELNATHYKVYGPKAAENWRSKADGRDFKFCPKMYKGVTHFGKLTDKDFLTNEFVRGVRAFKEHLGPIFIQLNDVFSPKRKTELFEFLSSLPTDVEFFLEVRHPDWFAQKDTNEELLECLRRLNIGSVITDTAGRRDCCHMRLTIPKAFIRYVGNSLHATDHTRIDAWINRMKQWLDNGIQEIYFFMHMHDEATSPELTVELVDKLNAVGGLNLIKPMFLNNEVAQPVKAYF